MPAINTTLFALNSISSPASTQPQCPVQHGLSHGDVAAIVLGSGFGLSWLLQCYLIVRFSGPIKEALWQIKATRSGKLFAERYKRLMLAGIGDDEY